MKMKQRKPKTDRSAVMKKAWATRRANKKAASVQQGEITVKLREAPPDLRAAREYQLVKELMEATDWWLRDEPEKNFFLVRRSDLEALKRVFGDKL